MTKLLFISASIAALAMLDPARAQMYLPPTPGGIGVAPSYRAPDYTAPGYKGYAAPGYQWREQRANSDWRNNTWREERLNEDWRTNNWRTQRANEDWRQRQDLAKERTKNNAIDRGYVECGVGLAGSSCRDYATDKPKNSAIDRGYVECGPNSVAETCRSRSDGSSSPPVPTPAKRAQSSETGGEKRQ